MHFEGLDIILFLTMEYFPGVGKIQYEGSASMNDLAFKWYNADQVVLGKVGLYLQLSLLENERSPAICCLLLAYFLLSRNGSVRRSYTSTTLV